MRASGVINHDWALVRYNSNGTLDSSFGSGGKVITNMGAQSESIEDVLVQADGKIIAAGNTSTPALGDVFAVARYNTNGTLDTTFGTGGKVLTDFSTGFEALSEIALQPDGKIVAVGRSLDQVGLARFNANGSLDSSFGTGGKVLALDGTIVKSVAIQTDGKIVVTGAASAGPQIALAVARFNSSGSLDTTFGTNGVVFTTGAFSIDMYGRAITIQSDGKILVGGQVNSDFLLVRYDSSGSLDTTFDTDGIVSTDFAGVGGSEAVNAMALQPDGKVILVGRVSYATGITDFGVARYICSCP